MGPLCSESELKGIEGKQMQCPCGAEAVLTGWEIKKPETVSAWAQKDVDCKSGKIDQWKCRGCGRISRTVYDENGNTIASFG